MMFKNSPQKKLPASESIDSLDVLASIWILSCNDENPIMTYKGLENRLNVPLTNIREIVQKRRELFRPGVSKRRLEEWKEKMLENTLSRNYVPSYIRSIQDADERKKEVRSLSVDDVFRNQFRTEENVEKASLEVLNWGLGHIDRSRKARTEAHEERVKRWSNIRLPLLSTLVALVAVMSSCFSQYQNVKIQQQNIAFQEASTKEQEKLKAYEIELKPLQESYAALVNALEESKRAVIEKSRNGFHSNFNTARKSYYVVELYLESDAEKISNELTEIQKLCTDYLYYQTPPRNLGDSFSFILEFSKHLESIRKIFIENIGKRKTLQ